MTLTMTTKRVKATLGRGASDARRQWTERDAIAIVLTDGELSGSAEAAPLPGFSVETLEHVARAIESIAWRSIDPEGDDPLSLAARIVPDEVPSARFAVEAALLDLAARRRGVTVAAMIAEGTPASALTTAALLDEPATALTRARIAIGAGAGALKVKIGREGRETEEIAMLRTLRTELGPSVRIRADANGALPSASDARIAALAEIGAELLEEPFASLDQLMSSDVLPVPVALDESLARDPVRALRAIESGRARAVVLKPAMLGGIGRALAIAEAARERGARSIVSHLYDPPRSFAACAHLALALAIGRAEGEVHGLASYAGLDAWADRSGSRIAVPKLLGAYRIGAPGGGGLG